MLQEHEIDSRELEGKSFDCVSGCALCCLCQPELSYDEYEYFIKDNKLSKGLTDEHISGLVTEIPNAIKLQGGCGGCFFLMNRRCLVYHNRPRMCRQFPIHVHVLDRIQLNANLSCRGIISGGGRSLLGYWKSIEPQIPKEMLIEQLNASRDNLLGFEERCRANSIYQSSERLLNTAELIIPLLRSRDGLGRLVAFTSESPVIGDMDVDDIVKAVSAAPTPEDLDHAAGHANYNQFELEDPAWLPIYIDDRLRWNTFRSSNGAIEWLELAEAGTLELREKFMVDEISLLSIDRTGSSVFADYAGVISNRDHFLGYTCYTCAESGFKDDMMTVYLGVLGTTMLDLWWRTSLIGKIEQKNVIDGTLAREGIVSFDMDLLDAPTIGAFV